MLNIAYIYGQSGKHHQHKLKCNNTFVIKNHIYGFYILDHISTRLLYVFLVCLLNTSGSIIAFESWLVAAAAVANSAAATNCCL